MKKWLFGILVSLCLVGGVVIAQPTKLDDYFGGHLPPVSDRVPIAEELGIQEYKGTKEQNAALLEALKRDDERVSLFGLNENVLGAGVTPVTGYQSRLT